MSKRLFRIIRAGLIAASLTGLLSIGAWALQAYQALISVQESAGNTYNNYPLIIPMPVTALIAGGYATNQTDIRVTTFADHDLPRMAADDKVLTVNDAFVTFSPSSTTIIKLRTGNANTDFALITGHNGYVTIPDAADIEPGNRFEILIDGWVNTATSGASQWLIKKPDGAGWALKVYVSAASTITADINNGAVIASAIGITSNVNTIRVVADGTNLMIFTVGSGASPAASTALGGASVTDTADDWILGQNDTTPYSTYVRIWK